MYSYIQKRECTTSNVAGKHEERFSRPNTAKHWTAVCCSSHYIFVADRHCVHVYSWTGRCIQTLSQQQLGIGKNDTMHAIQCNHDGTVLQLAKGDRRCVRSLHAYKVRPTFMSSYTTTLLLLGKGGENNINTPECDLC